MRILINEDDAQLAAALKDFLQQNGEEADIAATVFAGIEAGLTDAYDVMIVDMMLPDGNGIDVIRELRRLNSFTPALILTARNETEDRVTGLNAGADDYMGKPFEPEELLARVRALVRRSSRQVEPDVLTVGHAQLHLKSRILHSEHKQLELSSKEFLLLEYLIRHAGQILTREQLLSHLWGPDAETSASALDTYIYFLRKKCAQVGLRSFIKTVRGQGYMIQTKSQ